MLRRFDEIGMPYVFTCKNCGVISSSVDDSKISVDRDKVYKFGDIDENGFKEMHITERCVLNLLKPDSEWIDKSVEYKNIWKSIYKWFKNVYSEMNLTFLGNLTVKKLLILKNDIKKEVF